MSLKMVDGKQVEKILEQGQKLRNAMVETILKNDPFTAEVVPLKHYNTPTESSDNVLSTQSHRNPENNQEKQLLIEAYLKGDYLTKDQEKTALETLKSMSGVELSDATEQTLSSQENTTRRQASFIKKQNLNLHTKITENCLPNPCFCQTCKAYKGANLDCDLRRPQSQDRAKNIVPSKCFNPQNIQILKYADSLKISLHNIVLSEIGKKKTEQTVLPRNGVNETYFIEYHLPSSLLGNLAKNKSKVDSGLDNSSVRICSKKTGQLININHTFSHDIANLHEQNLSEIEIVFKINYRSQKQKSSQILGFSKLRLDSLAGSKNLSCNKALSIHFKSEDCPIVVGTLKISAQLGCGRTYFGKDFIDALSCDQNSETLDSEVSNSDIVEPISNEYPKDLIDLKNTIKGSGKSEKAVEFALAKEKASIKRPVTQKYHSSRASAYFVEQNRENSVKEIKHNPLNQETLKQLLFGFIYISEAQFLNHCPSSYVSCQPFCQNESSNSRLVADSSNPLYNFCQKVPLLYDTDLLLQLRENLTLIEFWERKDQSDTLFGITKLPLHQFYLAYRNEVILQHLTKNKLPIIGTDWWEPVYSIENEELIGQVQILTALGTEQQIENLESERGFKNDLVKAKYLKLPISKFRVDNIGINAWRDRVKVNKKSEFLTDSVRSSNYLIDKLHEKPSKLSKNIQEFPNTGLLTSYLKSSAYNPDLGVRTLKKVDIGIQSDTMDTNNKSEDQKPESSQSQDMIASFLKILDQHKQPRTTVMDNGTNTDNNPGFSSQTQGLEPKDIANSNLKKTSDLLDTLQKALSLDPRQNNVPRTNLDVFKAHVIIKSANHLPSKKKMKAKKSKNRGKAQEENIFPSTYVTFETVPSDSLKITNVVSKSTSPQWNYECDVELPTELLTNRERKLIFKVWKKSNNVVLQPNTQTDTVLGFAALDLTVLVAGLPNVQGWFNIVDFSGTCNGQINIHVTPRDSLNRFRKKPPKPQPVSNDTLPHTEEQDDDGNDLLGRALKRKFTELDEITQRLRLRLSEVVDQESENENDKVADEFERDIDSLCIEDDFDMVNFEEEANGLNINIAESRTKLDHLLSIDSLPGSSREVPEPLLIDLEAANATGNQVSGSATSLPTDRHLTEGKQRIDSLLEKLTLISAENAQAFSSRYVSGCSVSNQNLDLDTEHMLKDLDRDSRPNITSCTNLNKFKEFYGETLASQSEISTDKNEVNLLQAAALKGSDSESSVGTNFSDCRPNPDGQGNASDDGKSTS